MAARTGQQNSDWLTGDGTTADTHAGPAAAPGAGGTRAQLISYLLLAAALIAAVSGALVWALGRAEPRAVEIIIPTPAPLVVHVDGAVVNPGVYTLPPGSRAQDAIQAAGGLTGESTVNLAAPVFDGQRIFVGQLPPEGAVGAPGDVPAGASGRIDLNTATLEQLQQLTGIGPVRAAAIIDFRERNGPITFLDDLLAVDGIGPATIESLRPLVVQQ